MESRLQHKRGRKSNYVKSLNNDNHKEVKIRALLRDNFQCRENGCSCKIGLELHHITYFLNGENYIGKELENLQWVVIVCANHHQKIHNNISHKWNPKNFNKKPYNHQ